MYVVVAMFQVLAMRRAPLQRPETEPMPRCAHNHPFVQPEKENKHLISHSDTFIQSGSTLITEKIHTEEIEVKSLTQRPSFILKLYSQFLQIPLFRYLTTHLHNLFTAGRVDIFKVKRTIIYYFTEQISTHIFKMCLFFPLYITTNI